MFLTNFVKHTQWMIEPNAKTSLSGVESLFGGLMTCRNVPLKMEPVITLSWDEFGDE
jgi:hypothetical protein